MHDAAVSSLFNELPQAGGDSAIDESSSPVGECQISKELHPYRCESSIYLPWPTELYHRRKSLRRLAGIEVFHDFTWKEEFGHNSSAFKNGQDLAICARSECKAGKLPALVLTKRHDVNGWRSFEWNDYYVVVVNIDHYKKCKTNQAINFFASAYSSLTRLADLDDAQLETLYRQDPAKFQRFANLMQNIGVTPVSAANSPDTLRRAFETIIQVDGDTIDLALDMLLKGGASSEVILSKLVEKSQLEDFGDALEWFLRDENRKLFRTLHSLTPQSRQRLSALSNFTTLQAAWKVWNDHRTNQNEQFWQDTLTEHSFVLGQVFSYPIVMVEGQAYMGGRRLDRVGSKITDFLVKNSRTNNVVFVEIKKPQTPLLGAEYRGDVYNVHTELSGA